MKIVRGAVAVLLILLTSPAGAQIKKSAEPGGMRDPEPETSRSVEDVRPKKLLRVPFGSGEMTRQDAARYATGEGFRFFDLNTCPNLGSECAMVTVENRRGRAFDYYLTPIECEWREAGKVVRPDQNKKLAQQRTQEQAAEANPGRQADVCFGPYRAMFRVRHDMFLGIDHNGWVQNQTITLQTPETGRWRRLAEQVTSSWSLGTSVSSGLDVGWAYDLRDADGNTVASDEESSFMQSQSGGGEVSISEVCGARRDTLIAKAESTALDVKDACKVNQVIPDETTIEIGRNIGGVDTSVSLTKVYDRCEADYRKATKKADVAAKNFYEACLADPGQFFTQFADVPAKEVTITDLPGFRSTFTFDLRVAGEGIVVCPPTTTEVVEDEIADGRVCTGTVRYTCDTTTQATCHCHSPEVLELVCTEG